ncbi:hypothetical protein [Candidatus Nanohalovita haloferacivicina]|uniref:hypothetical protein n=1 Tax=Candidatus Nanohalovita haloferacivicina TaxID=2978046 RepID=UPI00325FC946|nr:hypothetical protein HBNXNv_1155 [Candidatus Nanohalobia archaeon BNXNv]
MGKNTFRHSDKAFQQIENIVEDSAVLENKSDFYQTVTDYALVKATEGEYKTNIDNFDAKVEELGLNQLSSKGLEHFDFAATVYHVARDDSKPADERMDYLQKISREEIQQYFPDTNLAEAITET